MVELILLDWLFFDRNGCFMDGSQGRFSVDAKALLEFLGKCLDASFSKGKNLIFTRFPLLQGLWRIKDSTLLDGFRNLIERDAVFLLGERAAGKTHLGWDDRIRWHDEWHAVFGEDDKRETASIPTR